MAKGKQKAIKTPTGEWMYISFRAHPEELADFQEVAAKLDRTVSWWVRDVLNREVARRKASSNNEIQPESANPTVGVEAVSPDRA
jgi:hypothetical protein